MAPVRLIEGDILEEDWSDADLVLATSLCFPWALQVAMHAKALQLKHGARVVCMQGDFDDQDDDDDDDDDDAAKAEKAARKAAGKAAAGPPPFRPVVMREEEPRHQIKMTMSFGETKFYVYERVVAA